MAASERKATLRGWTKIKQVGTRPPSLKGRFLKS
jgi:hypothetical protein